MPIAILLVVVYMANFQMAADHMFYQPKKVLMVNAAENKVDSGRLVIGVKINGEAKAYPIRFLGYHHQVQDTLGGEANYDHLLYSLQNRPCVRTDSRW